MRLKYRSVCGLAMFVLLAFSAVPADAQMYTRAGVSSFARGRYAGPGFGPTRLGRVYFPGYPGGVHPFERDARAFQRAYNKGNGKGSITYGPYQLSRGKNLGPYFNTNFYAVPGPTTFPQGPMLSPVHWPRVWNPPQEPGPAVMSPDKLVAADPVRGQPDKNSQPLDPAGLDRAQRLLKTGDERFAAGNFMGAYGQYHNARAAAPHYPPVHFRNGWAQAALGQYDRAAESIKEGLRLDDQLPRSGFDLRDLYAANERVRTVHLDALLAAAERSPENPDLQFLAGLQLYFGGQKPQSKPYFERAAAHSFQATHLLGFLEALNPPAQPVERDE